MPWPDEAEFTAFLQAAGLVAIPPNTVNSLLDLTDILAAAVEEWNELTGYWPFLATGVPETRSFEYPTGPIMQFDGGVPPGTTVTVATNVNVTNSYGTEQTSGINFQLWPIDAPNRQIPYVGIEFLTRVFRGFSSHIEVTADWGYCTDANLPRSARRALMALGALEALPQILTHLANGVIMWREGDVEKRFLDPTKIRDLWQGIVDAGLGRIYKRLRMG